jgi:5'-nucleotidase
MNDTPLILVTNDDGIHAAGLRVLAEAMADLGRVVVCAPEAERSGSSHSITLHTHLRANPVERDWWSVSGTPVDCVYLAALHLCERPPDLVLAGINQGFNLGSDVFYSGTVGAAAEGFIRGGSAAALSVSRDADPVEAVAVARMLTRRMLTADQRHLLNVNVPARATKSTNARIEVTRLGPRTYVDCVERRTDLQGRPYFWIGGPAAESADREGDDTWAIEQGRISVTPLELDLTATDLDPTIRLIAPEGEETGQ